MKIPLIISIMFVFMNANGQSKITLNSRFTNIFEFANIHDYTQSEIDTLKSSINLNKLPEKNVFSVENSESESVVKLLTNFKVIYNHETHIYIKYNVVKKGQTPRKEIIDLIYKKDLWLKNSITDSVFYSITKILINSNAEILFEFYNKENNSLYPVINSLKPFVKDVNGILDIYKLAEVIEKNKDLLSKYLDE